MARGSKIIRPDQSKALGKVSSAIHGDGAGLRLVESPYSLLERHRAATNAMRSRLRKHIAHREEWRLRLGVTLKPEPTAAERWASHVITSNKSRDGESD